MTSSQGETDRLRTAVEGVVQADLCTGCGVCELISDRVRMGDADGFRRPFVTGGPGLDDRREADVFSRSCPGRTLTAPRPEGSRRDDFLGPVLGAWRAWATDPEVRHRGSSGGTLTALQAFLAEMGQTASAAAAEPANPRRTVPVRITTREEALSAAGSRYAPVSAGGRSADGVDVMVGKPCEVAGRRQLDAVRGGESPLLVSFFCAGTPSQEATEALLEREGIGRDEPVEDLWYRGRGWPGDFTAVTTTGKRAAVDYSTSWGGVLGPTVQWRCRLCVDGVGEFADIVAGDFWDADERGYPVFDDAAGMSALIARTERGMRAVQEAVDAGVLEVEPMDVQALLDVQRYQVERRRYMAGRLVGNLLSGGRNPRYRGFRLLHLVRRSPRRVLHEVRGTIQRAAKRRGRGR